MVLKEMAGIQYIAMIAIAYFLGISAAKSSDSRRIIAWPIILLALFTLLLAFLLHKQNRFHANKQLALEKNLVEKNSART